MFGFDTETWLIEPGILCPRLVCLSLAGAGEPPSLPTGAVVRRLPDPGWTALLDRSSAVALVPSLLAGSLVGHNVAYDLAVLCEAHRQDTGSDVAIRLAFKALEDARIFDTKIRETLLRNAYGELRFTLGEEGVERSTYDLASLVNRYLGVDIGDSKTDPDAWRLRYRELDGLPVADWPVAAQDYALMDAFWPLLVGRAQVTANPPEAGGYPVHDGAWDVISEAREVGAAFALHLMAIWGLRTDPEAVATVLAEWRAGSVKGIELGKELGFIRAEGRDKGKPGSVDKKKLQALVSEAYRGDPPMTAPTGKFPQGQVKTSEETLEYSDDPKLREYAESLHFTRWGKVYGPTLEAAAGAPLTSSPNVLVASGRTSWAKPPLQQPPRKGGYRRCFVPRPGWLFASADYDFIELCSLAQVCLWVVGSSRLAETINAGRDPHMVMALEVLRAYAHPETPATYEEAVARKKARDPLFSGGGDEDHRQLAKSLNFGFPGGLGPDTFVDYAHANYGIELTRDKAAELREIWHASDPAYREYFAWVTEQIQGEGTIQQFVSGRVRGDVNFTAGANTFFQGLTADGAKWATFLVSKACYSEPRSPLFGSRPVLFLHDEIIIETPEDRAPEAGEELARIMLEGMRAHIPDVRIGCKPVLTRRWVKGADQTRDAAGRLAVTEEGT